MSRTINELIDQHIDTGHYIIGGEAVQEDIVDRDGLAQAIEEYYRERMRGAIRRAMPPQTSRVIVGSAGQAVDTYVSVLRRELGIDPLDETGV